MNPQCQTWNSLGSCLSCFTGYVLSGTGCVIGQNDQTSSNSSTSNIYKTTTNPSSSSISFSSSSFSSDPNCKTRNLDGSCSECYNSFYYDSISAKQCVSVNPLCKTWNSWGHCLSCYQGYDLFNNACFIESEYQQTLTVGSNDIPANNQDPYCNTYKDQVCIKCATRTYLDSVSKRCIQIDSNCKSWL